MKIKLGLLLVLLVSGLVMSAQPNYIPYQSRNRWIAAMFDSTLHIPRFNGAPSLRVGGSVQDGAIAADTTNNRLYLYNNGAWTLINKDTTNTFIKSVYRKTGTDSVFYTIGSSHVFAYKDSIGSGGGGGSDGYVDSVRFNSATNILTVYQNTAADQSVYLPPSYLNFDSSYTPLGGMRNDSTAIIPSIRIRRNNVTVTPTATGDSALLWNIDVPDTASLSTRINAKLDTAKAIPFDTTGAVTGYELYIDRTGADTIKTRAATGGSSGSGAFSKLEWFQGDENSPEIGDSILVHDSFPGKYLDVYRNGIKQMHVFNDTGFHRETDSTIKVKPPFAANEFWHIEARDSSAYTQLTLQAPYAPPSTTIAYSTSADGGNNGGSGTSKTWTHTVSSGSDRYLLVGIVGDTGSDDVSSVTYNGISMTLIGKIKQNSLAGNRWTYVYGLANPASGANTVSVSFSSSHWILAGSIEYTGVQGVDTYTSQTDFVTNLTTSLTTGVNNCWTILFSTTNGGTQSAGSGSTLRMQAGDSFWAWFDGGSAVTPAGSKSMNTSRPFGSGITHIMISLKPY